MELLYLFLSIVLKKKADFSIFASDRSILSSRKSVPLTRINNLIRSSRPSSIDRRNEITRSLNAAHPKSRYIPLPFLFFPFFHSGAGKAAPSIRRITVNKHATFTNLVSNFHDRIINVNILSITCD